MEKNKNIKQKYQVRIIAYTVKQADKVIEMISKSINFKIDASLKAWLLRDCIKDNKNYEKYEQFTRIDFTSFVKVSMLITPGVVAITAHVEIIKLTEKGTFRTLITVESDGHVSGDVENKIN